MPLCFFNFVPESLKPKDEEYQSGSGPLFNQEVVNPNTINRINAFPIIVKSSMPKSEQVSVNDKSLVQTIKFYVFSNTIPSWQYSNISETFIIQTEIVEMIITALEKFHWLPTEIAHSLKVILFNMCQLDKSAFPN